jgi:tetratricopeptide (TPR) repeat protein
MTAHEGSEHAEWAEQRDIGEATLDQMRADVLQLSRRYMDAEPFPLFQEMRHVRRRMYAALDRRLWPRDQADIYFLLGCLNCLMGATADDLGYPQAGEELYRAAWAYAVAIDQRPLMAKLRLDLASLAYWQNRPRQAMDLAQSGLTYMAHGPNAAQLQLKYARAAARIGDHESARQAIGAANRAREQEISDDLLELGGEFGLSRASQHYLTGSAMVETPGSERDAVAELARAVEMYTAGPEPGEDHCYQMEMLAHIDLAVAWLHFEDLDAASAALKPVLNLPASRRIDPLPKRLQRVRAEVAHRRYQGSPQARELDERIEEFSQETIVTDLHDLPASPG